jgi:hypothetical protein
MKAIEILRKIYLYDELPGHALIVDSQFFEREKEEHFASFFYSGKEPKENHRYLVIYYLRYFHFLHSIYGELFAEYGYENDRFYVWEIEE